MHILTLSLPDNFFVASTYKRILEYISKRALSYADLHMNEPIVKIEAYDRTNNNSTKSKTLTTAAGKKYRFDEVVVTCPLGWLKRNKSAFEPELPPHLIKAIDSISYGRLEKIYVTFPEAFWHHPTATTTTTMNGNGNEEDQDVNKAPSNTTETASSSSSSFQFLEPEYIQRPEGIKFWNQECLSLASLHPKNCAHPTLLFYTHGPCSTYIVQKLTSPTTTSNSSKDDDYKTLNTFLEPFYSRLPGYNPTSSKCKPIAFLATQWQKDPYAGNGSYCNFQIGLENGDKCIEIMRNGIGIERGVWFAGEHTAPFVSLGTTSGAYWSGERCSARICEFYGLGRVGIGVGRDDSLPSGLGLNGIS